MVCSPKIPENLWKRLKDDLPEDIYGQLIQKSSHNTSHEMVYYDYF